MASSFDPSLTTDKDWIRSRIGDKGTNGTYYLADQEIQGIINRAVTLDEASAVCAENLGAAYTTAADRVVQLDLKLDFGDRARKAYELADRIRNQAQPLAGEPTNPGAIGGRLCSPDNGFEFDPLPPLY